MATIYDIKLTSIDSEDIPLSQFKGIAVLLVNVASKCGLTPQYTALQNLYSKYATQGLAIVGLPCNQFMGQEPGTAEEIKDFCDTNYQVSFPLTAKIDVNGEGRHALYDLLAGDDAVFPGDITWNFEKFLINKDGDVVKRFAPQVTPDSDEVIQAIEGVLS